jgi:electron transfer flavoprotein beta subunit
MKLLVCVSKTPDTTAKIAFVNNNTALNSQGVQYIMNPYDEWYALVRAVELVEKNGGTVTLINVGPNTNDQVIRKGLAIGAHDAVRIEAADEVGSYYVAKQIAEYAKSGGYDIIFCGKETIDYNGSEVGAMVAELLDMPFVSYATALDVAGTTATVARDIEGGTEVVEVATPFVVSSAKGMAEQRIPNMQGIMKAKTKPFAVVQPVAVAELTQVVSYALPPEKTGCKMIDPAHVEQLVELLHTEAKVI